MVSCSAFWFVFLICLCSGSPDTSGGFELDDDTNIEDRARITIMKERVDVLDARITVMKEKVDVLDAMTDQAGHGDGMPLDAATDADTSSAVDLSDGSDIFALSINLNMDDVDSSFARSESSHMPSVGTSPTQDSYSTRDLTEANSTPPPPIASTPALSSSVVYHPTYPEEFVPAPGVVLQGQATTGEPSSFQIGKLLTVMPIPPVLKVPIWGAPPPPGETTLDGLTPLYFGEDSRVGRYAFYGEFLLIFLGFW